MQRNYKNTDKIPTFSYFKDRKIPTFSYFGTKIPTFSYFFDLSYHFQPCHSRKWFKQRLKRVQVAASSLKWAGYSDLWSCTVQSVRTKTVMLRTSLFFSCSWRMRQISTRGWASVPHCENSKTENVSRKKSVSKIQNLRARTRLPFCQCRGTMLACFVQVEW